MATANLCSRVDDLYTLLNRSEPEEDTSPDLCAKTGFRLCYVAPENRALLMPQNQAALETLMAELSSDPELKVYQLSADDLCLIANFFHAAGTEYDTDLSIAQLFGFLPERQWSLKAKVEFLLSLLDREILSFTFSSDTDFHHDLSHILQTSYRLNGLLWNIIMDKAPLKKAVSYISRGLRKGDLIQDFTSDALEAIFNYYPELKSDLKNTRGLYYGKTVNLILDKALKTLPRLGDDQPFKELCQSCVPDPFWQKCLLLIYHFERSKKDMYQATLSALLSRDAADYKSISSLLAAKNCLRQHELLETNNSIFSFQELNLSDAAKAKLSRSQVSESKTIESYLKQSEYFSLIQPEQDLEQLILAQDAMQNIVSVIKRLQNPDQDLLQTWGLIGASLTDDKAANHGCNILLHGEPGTGKTYIAGVIANQLKRPLLLINANNIRDCYYGSTEKRAKDLFREMRMLAQKYAPVFLLNEGDQLIHRRSEGARNGAENAENSIQSIFLEELETFGGTLVVTSNLLLNLDPAMSRRFHYKLLIAAPDYESRLKLWKLHLPSSIPGAGDIDLERLAEGFNFTGGQIRNVVLNACHQASCREDSQVLQSTDLWHYACLEGGTNFETKAKRVGF